MLVVGQEVPAGGPALACRDQVLVRAVRVHDEHLVAIVARPRALENEPLAVRRPIGFGVLPAMRKLADVAQARRLRGGNPNGRQCEQHFLHMYPPVY